MTDRRRGLDHGSEVSRWTRTWCAGWSWCACFGLVAALLLRPPAVVLVDASILALVAVLVDRLHAVPGRPVGATIRLAGRTAFLGTAATACATISWSLLALVAMCAALTSPLLLARVVLPPAAGREDPRERAIRMS